MNTIQSQKYWAAGSSFLIIAWMVFMNIRPIQDPDFWWHLASGRYMVTHFSIPTTDVFSLTARGSAWVNTYWLQEIATYILYRIGGFYGITLINSVVIALTVYLIASINPFNNLSWATRLLGAAWIFLAGQPRGYGWEEKASFVTLVFLALLFYTIRLQPGSSQTKWMWVWPFLFIAWANMHRGFILGLAILSLYTAEEWWRGHSNRTRLSVWWVSCVAATLVNPWGIRVYGMGWHDFSLSPTLAMGWAQTPFYHLELFWMTLMVFWCLVGWNILKKRPLSMSFLLTSVILSVISIRYASLYRYFVIWAVPWLLGIFQARARAVQQVKILAVAIGLMAVASYGAKPGFGIDKKIFPVDAVDFLKRNNLRQPFFHEYGFGGFFLWTLEGRPPVLIDGRIPAVQGYRNLYPEIQNATHGPPADFQRFLESLGLQCAVVQYPSTQSLPNPLSVYFPPKQWALIYWDDLVLIFVRRIPDFKEAIQAYEFRFVQPATNPLFWLKTEWAQASPSNKIRLREEFLRNAHLHPASKRAQWWLRLTSPSTPS